jgi:hypothetical protein
MAQAYLQISEYGTLNFSNDWRQCEQWRRDYAQRVVAGDVVTVQYGVPKGLSQTWTAVEVRQYNLTTGVVATLSPSLVSDGDGFSTYNVTANSAAVGCYRLAIEVTAGGQTAAVAESVFEVVAECPGSLLFRYQNEREKDGTVFSQPFNFRCPAKFFPQNEEYNAEDNAFRDQEYTPSLLSSEAYTAYGLTVGGPQGVPTWVGRKLNAILSCTELYLGEVGSEMQFVKSNGGKIERVGLGDMNPFYQFNVSLEKVSDGVLIGEYIPDEEEYSDIVIRVKFMDGTEEEVPFDISPTVANFEYNDTAARTIAVTAANSNWAVTAGDTSWLTVTKTGDGTATITPTQNPGTANRTQNVTFTWVSSAGVPYIKTLTVTQFAQGVETGLITITGKVTDAATGLPIANIPLGRIYVRSQEDAGGANMQWLGSMSTDAAGDFSLTVDISSDEWAKIAYLVMDYAWENYGAGAIEGYVNNNKMIASPAFATAVASGVSFGTVPLTPEPTSEIEVRVKFVEETLDSDTVLMTGRVVGPFGPDNISVKYSMLDSPNDFKAWLNGGTAATAAQPDKDGYFSFTWGKMDSQTWNNIYAFRFRGWKTYGGAEKFNIVYAALLPEYDVAVKTGANVGEVYL